MTTQKEVKQFVFRKNAQLTPETDCGEMLNQVKEKMISVQPEKYTEILNSLVTMLTMLVSSVPHPENKFNPELKQLLDANALKSIQSKVFSTKTTNNAIIKANLLKYFKDLRRLYEKCLIKKQTSKSAKKQSRPSSTIQVTNVEDAKQGGGGGATSPLKIDKGKKSSSSSSTFPASFSSAPFDPLYNTQQMAILYPSSSSSSSDIPPYYSHGKKSSITLSSPPSSSSASYQGGSGGGGKKSSSAPVNIDKLLLHTDLEPGYVQRFRGGGKQPSSGMNSPIVASSSSSINFPLSSYKGGDGAGSSSSGGGGGDSATPAYYSRRKSGEQSASSLIIGGKQKPVSSSFSPSSYQGGGGGGAASLSSSSYRNRGGGKQKSASFPIGINSSILASSFGKGLSFSPSSYQGGGGLSPYSEDSENALVAQAIRRSVKTHNKQIKKKVREILGEQFGEQPIEQETLNFIVKNLGSGRITLQRVLQLLSKSSDPTAIAKQQSLKDVTFIGKLQPIRSLGSGYPYNQELQQSFQYIKDFSQSDGWRTIRGDGACYYRAVMFGVLSIYILDSIPIVSLSGKIKILIEKKTDPRFKIDEAIYKKLIKLQTFLENTLVTIRNPDQLAEIINADEDLDEAIIYFARRWVRYYTIIQSENRDIIDLLKGTMTVAIQEMIASIDRKTYHQIKQLLKKESSQSVQSWKQQNIGRWNQKKRQIEIMTDDEIIEKWMGTEVDKLNTDADHVVTLQILPLALQISGNLWDICQRVWRGDDQQDISSENYTVSLVVPITPPTNPYLNRTQYNILRYGNHYSFLTPTNISEEYNEMTSAILAMISTLQRYQLEPDFKKMEASLQQYGIYQSPLYNVAFYILHNNMVKDILQKNPDINLSPIESLIKSLAHVFIERFMTSSSSSSSSMTSRYYTGGVALLDNFISCVYFLEQILDEKHKTEDKLYDIAFRIYRVLKADSKQITQQQQTQGGGGGGGGGAV